VSPPFSLTPPPQAVQEKGDLNSYLYSSIDDTKVLLTAGEGGSRYREYSFVRDPSLAEELEYAG